MFITDRVAEFTPAAGSTGRFAKVVGGSFIMSAVTEPFVLGSADPVGYSWFGDGTLTFKNGKRAARTAGGRSRWLANRGASCRS
jgi:hypothetical protein